MLPTFCDKNFFYCFFASSYNFLIFAVFVKCNRTCVSQIYIQAKISPLVYYAMQYGFGIYSFYVSYLFSHQLDLVNGSFNFYVIQQVQDNSFEVLIPVKWTEWKTLNLEIKPRISLCCCCFIPLRSTLPFGISALGASP